MNTKVMLKRLLAIAIIAAMVSPLLTGPTPVVAQETKKVVFDISHGQYNSATWETDQLLAANLTEMGYTVVWAKGGINDTILSDAVGLVISSLYGESYTFTSSEVTAIQSWFETGRKFLWVAYDSDYSGAYINDNMTQILEAVGSHVYGEPTSIEDPDSNCGAGYRPVANTTSTDPFVADIVEGTTKVLMHGPTLLYGSNSDTPGENVNPVALEDTTIENVYPLLYYGASATIVDHDLTLPYAHTEGDNGSFVAMTLEVNAGPTGDSVIVVSGASPYGDYRPMASYEYKGVTLDGYNIVKKAIDFGITYALTHTETTTTTTTTTTSATPVIDTTLLLGGVGVVVVIVIIVVLMKRR